MISISQVQIAKYLHDYASLTILMLDNPDNSPFYLFQDYMLKANRSEDANETYYNRMLNIAYIYTKMKMFSIAEDYTLKNKNNFINNDDLDLSFLDSCITGNRSSISNKKILQMIRDGFNHTTEDNQLYKISPNAKYIEFTFKEPTPLKIKLSINDISSLTSAIGEAANHLQYFSFNQPVTSSPKEFYQNISITRHLFPKKVDKTTISTLLELDSQGKYEESIDLVKTINTGIEKEIKLTDIQINTIMRKMEDLLNSGIITKEQFIEFHQELAVIMIGKELPIPMLKFEYYAIDSFFISQLLPHQVFTYKEMLAILNKGLENDEDQKYSFRDFLDNNKNLIFKTYYTNADERTTYSSLLFIEFILTNFPPVDEYIKIGNRTVEYKKLRNSIVHGRWHQERDKIVFYDTLPRIEKELDFNWKIKLNIFDLYDYCTNILRIKESKDKPKQLTKTILETKKD